MSPAATSGRVQARRTRRGALRQDAPKSVVPSTVTPIRNLTGNDFRLVFVQDKEEVDITSLVESVEWSDTSEQGSLNSWPTLTGSVTLRQPDPDSAYPAGWNTTAKGIRPNSQIMCWCQGERIWVMRVVRSSYSAQDGTVALELQDEMRQLALSRGRFHYVKDARHSRGWRPDQIALDVCKKYKIPYGALFIMRINGSAIHLTKLSHTSDSPTGIIRAAYSEGQKRTAQRYVMRWNHADNELEVKPMKESKTLYSFTERQIENAQVDITPRGDFATALRTVWWKPKPKGAGSKWKPKKRELVWVVRRGKKRLRTRVKVDFNAVQRYGYIEKRIEFASASEANAKQRTTNELAKRIRPIKTLSFTVPGEPRIRRGDFIVVDLPAQGFTQTQMWVQNVSHTLGDRYTMEITARFDNPMSPSKIRKEQQAAKRYRASLRRKAKANARRRGAGGVGHGQWVRVGATIDNYSGGAVACGPDSKNGGFSYAEFGVDGANKGMPKNGGFLADLFGITGSSTGVPCRFPIQVCKVRHPEKTWTIIKCDNGSGQPGDPHFKVDLEPGITAAMNFGGRGDIWIRRAD